MKLTQWLRKKTMSGKLTSFNYRPETEGGYAGSLVGLELAEQSGTKSLKLLPRALRRLGMSVIEIGHLEW